MATRRNTTPAPGVRAAGSRPAGSSAHPRDGRLDSLMTGPAQGTMEQADRSTLGNGKPYVIPTNAR